VVIAEVGATLRAYRDASGDIISGFSLSDYAPSGAGQILAPWPNRIENGTYAFNGRTITAPIDDRGTNSSNHGLVRWRPWTLLTSAQNRVVLEITLLPTPAYPFALTLEVDYHLGRSGLTVTTTAVNVGSDPCPFGLGFHPYFAAPVAVDDLELVIPATSWFELDENLIPTGTVRPVEETTVDFRTVTPIGSSVINTTFTDLARHADGRAVVQLHDRWRGRTTSVWMDEHFSCVQVYTGDSIAREDRRRRAVAIEPMTCPPNAFNSGIDLAILDPGQSVAQQWGITPEGGA
jgi:aldose 1-epimerase